MTVESGCHHSVKLQKLLAPLVFDVKGYFSTGNGQLLYEKLKRESKHWYGVLTIVRCDKVMETI